MKKGPAVPGTNGKEPGMRYGRIYIEDNGIGFDQKYAEQIFDMFRRLHSSAEYEGTGIGLALCKKIVHDAPGLYLGAGPAGGRGCFYRVPPAAGPKK